MKKILLILLVLLASNAYADVCYVVGKGSNFMSCYDKDGNQYFKLIKKGE